MEAFFGIDPSLITDISMGDFNMSLADIPQHLMNFAMEHMTNAASAAAGGSDLHTGPCNCNHPKWPKYTSTCDCWECCSRYRENVAAFISQVPWKPTVNVERDKFRYWTSLSLTNKRSAIDGLLCMAIDITKFRGTLPAAFKRDVWRFRSKKKPHRTPDRDGIADLEVLYDIARVMKSKICPVKDNGENVMENYVTFQNLKVISDSEELGDTPLLKIGGEWHLDEICRPEQLLALYYLYMLAFGDQDYLPHMIPREYRDTPLPTQGVEHKDKGNGHFKKQKYERAINEYQLGLKYAPFDHRLHGNLSLCWLKLHNWPRAKWHALVAMCVDETWEKAHYRYVQALIHQGRLHHAQLQLADVLEVCSTTKELLKLPPCIAHLMSTCKPDQKCPDKYAVPSDLDLSTMPEDLKNGNLSSTHPTSTASAADDLNREGHVGKLFKTIRKDIDTQKEHVQEIMDELMDYDETNIGTGMETSATFSQMQRNLDQLEKEVAKLIDENNMKSSTTNRPPTHRSEAEPAAAYDSDDDLPPLVCSSSSEGEEEVENTAESIEAKEAPTIDKGKNEDEDDNDSMPDLVDGDDSMSESVEDEQDSLPDLTESDGEWDDGIGEDDEPEWQEDTCDCHNCRKGSAYEDNGIYEADYLEDILDPESQGLPGYVNPQLLSQQLVDNVFDSLEGPYGHDKVSGEVFETSDFPGADDSDFVQTKPWLSMKPKDLLLKIQAQMKEPKTTIELEGDILCLQKIVFCDISAIEKLFGTTTPSPNINAKYLEVPSWQTCKLCFGHTPKPFVSPELSMTRLTTWMDLVSDFVTRQSEEKLIKKTEIFVYKRYLYYYWELLREHIFEETMNRAQRLIFFLKVLPKLAWEQDSHAMDKIMKALAISIYTIRHDSTEGKKFTAMVACTFTPDELVMIVDAFKRYTTRYTATLPRMNNVSIHTSHTLKYIAMTLKTLYISCHEYTYKPLVAAERFQSPSLSSFVHHLFEAIKISGLPTSHLNVILQMSGDDEKFSFLREAKEALTADVKARILNSKFIVEQGSEQTRAMMDGFGLLQEMPFFVLFVHRSSLIEDALSQISECETSELKRPLKVMFIGEPAEDQGGVKREFFSTVMRELFAPEYGMFVLDPDTQSWWFSETSFESNDQFNLIGQLLALAIYNDVPVDVHFPKVLYRMLKGKKPCFQDFLESFPQVGNSLLKMLDYNGNDFESVMGLTFSVESMVFGEKKVDELIPNGEKCPVTKENRHDYLHKLVEYKLAKSIERQFLPFQEGFYRILDQTTLGYFDDSEIDEILSGNDVLDWDTIETNARYEGEFDPDHPTIVFFWTCLRQLDTKQQRYFLAFATGSERVHSDLELNFASSAEDKNRVMESHTCMNLIVMPEYDSLEMVKDRLMTAINNHEGFGML